MTLLSRLIFSIATLPLPRRGALVFVFAWFFVGGLGHFVATDFFASIVPPWWPWPRAAVLVSGVFELVGALGLLFPATRSAAGWGLCAIIVLVTPAHVFMLQRPDLFPKIPYWALVARLPLQLVVIFCAGWSTRPTRRVGLRSGARTAPRPQGR